MKPFRAEINYTIAAKDLEEANAIFDWLTAQVDGDPRINFEGGAVGAMDPADVIAGSPLARILDEGSNA